MNSKSNPFQFPVWQYLNQPLFNLHNPLILNPQRFWFRHQIRHLERCLSRAYRPEERYRN